MAGGTPRRQTWSAWIRQGADRLAPAGTRHRWRLRGLVRALDYAFRHSLVDAGLSYLAEVVELPIARQARYSRWQKASEPNADDLERQRAYWARDAEGIPSFEWIVDGSEGPADELIGTIQSIADQTYRHWRATVLLGPPTDRRAPSIPSDPRIRMVTLSRTPDLTSAMETSLVDSDADFVITLEAGDRVPPWALHRVAFEWAEEPGTDFFYSDEDRLDRGKSRGHPKLKTAWSPTLFANGRELGRLCAVRRQLLIDSGMQSSDEFAELEANLVATAIARARRIRHVPAILCHRGRPSRSAIGRHSKPSTAGKETLRADPPSVSVIIPTRDAFDLIRTCLWGLLHGTDYPRLEIILVDSGSTDARVWRHYNEVSEDGRVRVESIVGPFNYSRSCNRGAQLARGEALVFLNNDVEIIHPDWLHRLSARGSREDVGLVGAKLVYPTGRIQHAGVALSGPMLAEHLYRDADPNRDGPFPGPNVSREVLMVTGACHWIRRDRFLALNGYDEQYHLCYSDLALGLACWERSWRVVYAADVELIHHEASTRVVGSPAEWTDARRFAREVRRIGITRDPFLHPRLTLLGGVPVWRGPSQPDESFELARNLRRLGEQSTAPAADESSHQRLAG